uniref:Uncharacterized protein n=1 Tax=Zea mays TaxID=4577 RepID=C4J1N9_MAIZE|nr:unknown [Zea mays]
MVEVDAPRHCRKIAIPVVSHSPGAVLDFVTNHQSGKVFVRIGVVLVALQIVPCDEILNPLLYGFEVRLKHAAKLLNTFSNQLLMTHNFAALHNAHN